MTAARKSVVFFHSVICPRCAISGLALSRVLAKFPEIDVTRVEFLSNRERARAAGIRSIPALLAEDRALTGVVLTPGRIEKFFRDL